VRREHDALEEEVDWQERQLVKLERKIEDIERGGLMSRLASLLRDPSKTRNAKIEECDQLQTALAQDKKAIAEFVAEELRIVRELERIPAARLDLAELKAAKILTLGAAEGPLGDELRMLNGAIEKHRETRELLNALLSTTERAAKALGDIIEGTEALDKLPDGGWAVLEAVASQSTDNYREREAAAARVREHLPFAAQVLGEALEALEASRDELRSEKPSPIPPPEALQRIGSLWATREALDPSLLLSQQEKQQKVLSDIDSILSALSTSFMRVTRAQEEFEAKRDARIAQF
jgi:hypothetical protein